MTGKKNRFIKGIQCQFPIDFCQLQFYLWPFEIHHIQLFKSGTFLKVAAAGLGMLRGECERHISGPVPNWFLSSRWCQMIIGESVLSIPPFALLRRNDLPLLNGNFESQQETVCFSMLFNWFNWRHGMMSHDSLHFGSLSPLEKQLALYSQWYRSVVNLCGHNRINAIHIFVVISRQWQKHITKSC